MYHCGASRTPSSPWLSKKRTKKRAGISRMRAGDDDQMAAPIGARKWSVSAAPVAAALEELADREAVAVRIVEHGARIAEETPEIQQQAGERRPHEIAPLCEQAAQPVPGEFEVAALAAHRERHGRGTQPDSELLHESEENGIVTFVANNEPRVERVTAGEYCVCVSPCPLLGLEQDDIAMRVEAMCGGEPGDAGADDGDLHLRRDPQRRPQLLPTG